MVLYVVQRHRAMPNLAALVREGGTVIMKIRHGPVPPGRRMFEITPEETIGLARMQGLHPVLNLRTESSQEANRAAGVDWTFLAFVKGKGLAAQAAAAASRSRLPPGLASIPDSAAIMLPAADWPPCPFRSSPFDLPFSFCFEFCSSCSPPFAACFSAFLSAFFSALAFSRSFSALASARFFLRFLSQASHLQPIGFRYALK